MKTDVKQVVRDVISEEMERVMSKVPFLLHNWKVENPLYAALVPHKIFIISNFERYFIEIFNNIWIKLAQGIAEKFYGFSKNAYLINGSIHERRLRRIIETINRLEHSNKKDAKMKPDWDNELAYILEGKGNLIPVTVVCDLYIENTENGKRYAFELKSPLPNSDITKVSKEKILKLYSMQPQMIDDAFFALPYNPFIIKENYNWSFPARWFNMKTDKVVLIGDEFWNFIGGEGTYQMFICEINKLGYEYRERIYKEFLGFEPPNEDILL